MIYCDTIKMAQTKKIIIYAVTALILFASCTESSRLSWVLEQAGENRVVLEQVLEHYKYDKEKRKAAEFLIYNMPFYRGESVREIDTIKAVRKDMFLNEDFSKEKMKEWKKKNWTPVCYRSDIRLMSADLLIENIDYAFKAWREHSWCKHYTFEEFCEYVLPYRLFDEPLESWRKMYYDKYSVVLDSLYQGTDVVEAGRLLAAYLKDEGYFFGYNFNISHIGPSFLFKYRTGYCSDFCDVVAYVFRSVGIPVAVDYYLQSPSNNSTHSWNAIVDTTGRAVHFNYTDEFPIGREVPMNRKSGKVYRYCFGVQKEKYNGLYEDFSVPSIFRQPFTKDVSEEYYGEATSKVCIEGQPCCEQWAYLSIYTGNKYKEVDVAPITKGKAVFRHLEHDVLYHPTISKVGNTFASGFPFMLDSLGNQRIFKPDLRQLHEVCLTRKYPMRKEAGHLVKIVDIRIEGSNEPHFVKPELLYCVKDTPTTNYNVFLSESHSPFRYIRLKGSEKRKMGVAEWHLYEYGNEGTPIQPASISHGNVEEPNWERAKNTFMDGDWVTWFAATYKGSELVQDLGRPHRIEKILLIPQNDDNFVRKDDEYELFFQNGADGWISLGKKKAAGTTISFRVPDNAVLWLKNHTRGKEERCFFMDGEVQIFP